MISNVFLNFSPPTNQTTVDKFLGDGYLCLFDTASDAISSARAIHAVLRKLSATSSRSVRMGIGINHGVAMIGCLGVIS
jgi:class 3 adenylate cyclase